MFNGAITWKVCRMTLALVGVLGIVAAEAGPLDLKGDGDRGTLEAIHEAEHVVDHAWETYHQSALGGTIASPTLQMEIELHLHEARTLLPKAQEAAEDQNHEHVKDVLRQIHLHTQRAIEG